MCNIWGCLWQMLDETGRIQMLTKYDDDDIKYVHPNGKGQKRNEEGKIELFSLDGKIL